MNAKRGKLLFRVAAEKPREGSIWAIEAIGLAIVYAYGAYKEHRSDWGMLIFFAGYGLSFLWNRKVEFYENGMQFPQQQGGGPRFIAWPQIQRFYWDDDVLTIVPASSVLSNGGGVPVLGGSVRIPMARRVQVENLLGAVSGARL